MQMDGSNQQELGSLEWMGKHIRLKTAELIILFYKIVTSQIINFIFLSSYSGMTFRLGICVPMAITREDISVSSWLAMEGKRSSWRDVKNGVENDAISEAATLEELDSDDTKNVFFDRVKG